MSGSVATRALRSIHTKDPRVEINEALAGWIDEIAPTGKDVVVCVYERPANIEITGKDGAKTKLWTPENKGRVAEDKFQGVVGLIVKMGPNIGEVGPLLGRVPQVGDWIMFRNQDANQFVLGDRAMRFLEGQFIRMFLKTPDCVI